MKERFCRWFIVLKQFLINFNVFRSHFAPTTDQYKIKTQIIATRIYLLLLVVSFFTLITHTSQVEVTQSVTVRYPSYDQFLSLSGVYSQTLSCPCTNLSIAYDQFIYLNATYHQVCESVYTTPVWQQLIDSTANENQTSWNFRYIGGPLFSVLNSFCYLSSTTVTDGIIEFNATQLISGTALSLDIFNSEVEGFIRLFISTTTREFTRLREMIRDQIQYDGILSGLYTNFYYKTILHLYPAYPPNYWFNPIPRVYLGQSSNCSCEETPLCVRPAFIDDENTLQVPGMYHGCYIVESLLQSNLACFYNQSCVDELRYILNSTLSPNTTALDPNIQSQYVPNDTVEYIVNQLMVEQWINKTSHEFYYNQCRPALCTYTYVSKKNWISVFTSILIPIGGLNIILMVIVPRIIWMLRSRRRINSGMLSILLFHHKLIKH